METSNTMEVLESRYFLDNEVSWDDLAQRVGSIVGGIEYGDSYTSVIEAKQFIPARVKQLAAKYNFKYNKVFIKNIKSRWGSCSKKGNLNFSLHLMLLPEELIDYVILHELVHTVEHNHSKNFWAVLNKIYGNAKTIDRKLKNYRIGIW